MDSTDPREMDSEKRNASTVTLWPSTGNQQMPDAQTYPESPPQPPPRAFISPGILYFNQTGSGMSWNIANTQDFELGNINRPLPPEPIQASFWEKRGLETPAQNPARRKSSNIKSLESKQTGKLGIFRNASKNIARHWSQALNELGDMMYPPTEKAKPRQPHGLDAARAVSTPEQYKQNLPRETSLFTNNGYDWPQKLDSPPMRLRPPFERWSEHEIRDEEVPQNTAVLYQSPKNGRLPIRQLKAQEFGQTQQRFARDGRGPLSFHLGVHGENIVSHPANSHYGESPESFKKSIKEKFRVAPFSDDPGSDYQTYKGILIAIEEERQQKANLNTMIRRTQH